MYDQDRDRLVIKQDLMSRIEFNYDNNQQTIDQNNKTNKSQSLDRAIGDIMLNSKLFNTISITLINTNVYKRSVVCCSLVKVDMNG